MTNHKPYDLIIIVISSQFYLKKKIFLQYLDDFKLVFHLKVFQDHIKFFRGRIINLLSTNISLLDS